MKPQFGCDIHGSDRELNDFAKFGAVHKPDVDHKLHSESSFFKKSPQRKCRLLKSDEIKMCYDLTLLYHNISHII